MKHLHALPSLALNPHQHPPTTGIGCITLVCIDPTFSDANASNFPAMKQSNRSHTASLKCFKCAAMAEQIPVVESGHKRQRRRRTVKDVIKSLDESS